MFQIIEESRDAESRERAYKDNSRSVLTMGIRINNIREHRDARGAKLDNDSTGEPEEVHRHFRIHNRK